MTELMRGSERLLGAVQIAEAQPHLADLIETTPVVGSARARSTLVLSASPLFSSVGATPDASPKRAQVAATLGKKEADRLTEMTKKLYLGQVEPEEVISQLRELADVR